MSTTRTPRAATAILSSLLLLLLSVSDATPWQKYAGKYRYARRFTGSRTAGPTPPSGSPTSRQNRTGDEQSVKLAREFLNAHNKFRAAKDQPLLKWDSRLARFARRWGAQRKGDCDMIHSRGPYGENLFWGGKDHWTPTEVVHSWGREQNYYDVNANSCMEGQMCGHYTQIVWKSTTRVGCWRQKCTGGGLFVVCNYDPPGNYIDESPFDQPITTDDQNKPSPPPPSSSVS
ncbi:hypothetical protein ACOSP7_029826 [Xanthoceras sorbifolium]|uniref:SCP domain-containing protein n=1 Tax=Xanthoceras sorbifolium TaxID=99658 RepID=A0ABQ8HAE1_9ROSI|nr:hypothetical protein JRO89_XS12G0013700 [Xanthoceras sorbifolium]